MKKGVEKYSRIFANHFKLEFCQTCHSLQGCSIKENITIFNANMPYVSKRWLYTAITRVRKLEQLTVFEHSQEEVERYGKARINQYFNLKIEGYKQQDKKRFGDLNELQQKQFVNVRWVQEQFESSGGYCTGEFCDGDAISIEIDNDNKVSSNITVDRLSNSSPHLRHNCQLLCLKCNVSKK